jgi:hypothetical protein
VLVAVLLVSESAEFGCSDVSGDEPARHCTEQGRHHQADPKRCRHLGDEEPDLRFPRVLDDEDEDQYAEHDAEDQTRVQARLRVGLHHVARVSLPARLPGAHRPNPGGGAEAEHRGLVGELVTSMESISSNCSGGAVRP